MGDGFTRLTFEVPALINLDEDLNFAANTVPESFFSLRANAFATTAISPWVSFGGGIGHFKPSSQLVFGGAKTTKGSTTGIFQMGFGLDVGIKRTISVRGEVRNFRSGTQNLGVDTGKSRQHNFFWGGAVWRFGKSFRAQFFLVVVISSYNSGRRRASSEDSPNLAAS
jgi:hypothetical protein